MRYIKLYESFGEQSSYNEIIEFLESNCKEFLDELVNTQSELFLRGVKNRSFVNDYEVKTVRKDRRPMDMNVKVNDKLSDAFIKKFGISIRKEGVFATKNADDADNYGEISLFFPIGDYKYYYSNMFKDLFVYLDKKAWYKGVRLGYQDYSESTSDGEYCYDDIRSFSGNKNNAVYILKRSYKELEDMTDDSILNVLRLKKSMNEEEYDNYINDISTKDINEIVDSYQTDSLSDVVREEVIFICETYCLVDSGFYRKITEYLKNRIIS